jgi:beta-phosphoglucomutase-like phosphatase (HAD superfamily)
MIARWYQRKTQIYAERVAAGGGGIPARPGIRRLAGEADAAGWRLAVASRSPAAFVQTLFQHAVGSDLAARSQIVAADIVGAKKSASDIYRAALETLGADDGGLNSRTVIAVEDSAIGVRAARSTGLRTLVTVSGYTVTGDFTGAALVVSSLGKPHVVDTVTLADPFLLQLGPSLM